MMTNSELRDAITAAKAMVDATGSASPGYQVLLAHLERLLEIQAARAGRIEHSVPYYIPYYIPYYLPQPTVMPQWIPAGTWQPPFVVTCGTGGP